MTTPNFQTRHLVVPASANQDRAAIFPTDNGVILVVADGAGGMPGGAAAADAVIAAVASAVQARVTINAMQILADVDRALALAYGGQTTAVIAKVTSTTIRGASVGDSRAWIVREDSFVDLTEAQHAKPLVGSGHAIPTALTNTAQLDGTLVLATDGVFKYSNVEELCDAALDSNLDTIPAALIDLARLPNGKLPDDAAVIICR